MILVESFRVFLEILRLNGGVDVECCLGLGAAGECQRGADPDGESAYGLHGHELLLFPEVKDPAACAHRHAAKLEQEI